MFSIDFAGANVTQLLVHDYDEGDNARVTFSLQDVPVGDQGDFFTIDTNTGLITTTDTANIDREVIDTYTVTAVAKDNPQNGAALTSRLNNLNIKYIQLSIND